jgi:hypothetical protein
MTKNFLRLAVLTITTTLAPEAIRTGSNRRTSRRPERKICSSRTHQDSRCSTRGQPGKERSRSRRVRLSSSQLC